MKPSAKECRKGWRRGWRLPSWVEEQLGTAEHDRLRALMRDLLFADSLDGLFKDAPG
jgi:hypothetical protein